MINPKKNVSFFLVLIIICIMALPLWAGGTKEGAATDELISIELMEPGWVNTPTDENDPYLNWLNDEFGVDFKLTNTSQFDSQVMVRFASDDPPDIIFFGNDKVQFNKIYNQGVLLEDWTPYLSKVPTIIENYSEAAKLLFLKDGKLTGLAKPEPMNTWSYRIRKDWMTSLNLKLPKTDKELLDVARALTNNDPDKDGENDTFAFTSAGGGKGLGEIENLLSMYGPNTFYLDANGTVQHPVIDGNLEKFYDFMRTVVDEKLIDPDWYTQGWEERKAALFGQEAYGIVYWPGVIVTESELFTGNDGKTLDWWETLPNPKGTPNGGKLMPSKTYSGIISISKNAAENPQKLEKILEIIEAVAWPNDGFFKLRWGIGIDNYKLIDLGDGWSYTHIYNPDDPSAHYRGPHEGGNLGAFDWGTWIEPGANDKVIAGNTPKPGEVEKIVVELNNQTLSMARYSSEGQLLDLDASLMLDVEQIKKEFEIKYILGEDLSYEEFKQNWLSAGGQKLLDQAKEQFKALGIM